MAELKVALSASFALTLWCDFGGREGIVDFDVRSANSRCLAPRSGFQRFPQKG
jgi:hypothetical protein